MLRQFERREGGEPCLPEAMPGPTENGDAPGSQDTGGTLRTRVPEVIKKSQ